jgi:hypothetical protein
MTRFQWDFVAPLTPEPAHKLSDRTKPRTGSSIHRPDEPTSALASDLLLRITNQGFPNSRQRVPAGQSRAAGAAAAEAVLLSAIGLMGLPISFLQHRLRVFSGLLKGTYDVTLQVDRVGGAPAERARSRQHSCCTLLAVVYMHTVRKQLRHDCKRHGRATERTEPTSHGMLTVGQTLPE